MIKYRIIDLLRGTKIVLNYKRYKKLFSHNNNSLLKLQKKHLCTFLTNIKTNVFFKSYLNKYSDKDIEQEPYKVLASLPFMDKKSITNNFDLLLNKSKPFEHTYTGGSTGSPFHYAVDKKSISKLRAFNYFLWNKYLNYNLGDRIIVIAGSSLGSKESIKKRVYNFLQNKTFISGGVISSENAKRLVKLINRSKGKIFLYAYPSSLLQYISIINLLEIKIQKEKIQAVICTSEMLYDDDKQTIESFFQKPVLNVYGANDGGIMSASFDNKNFLYNGLDCIVETKEIDGIHELLLTNLNSFAFPFVRYRVGDIGVVQKTEGFPFVLNNLIGRTRDFIYISKTEKIHGSVINKILKRYTGIQQYQVVQNKDLSCVLKLSSEISIDKHKISNEILSDLSPIIKNIKIDIVYTNSFIQAANSKQKLIVSYVD